MWMCRGKLSCSSAATEFWALPRGVDQWELRKQTEAEITSPVHSYVTSQGLHRLCIGVSYKLIVYFRQKYRKDSGTYKIDNNLELSERKSVFYINLMKTMLQA